MPSHPLSTWRFSDLKVFVNWEKSIIYKANYAMNLLSKIPKIKTPVFKATHFKEFTVNFDEADLTVKDVNKRLLERGIQGGKDLSKEYPELGQTGLFCVTEIHSQNEIQRLATALKRNRGRKVKTECFDKQIGTSP